MTRARQRAPDLLDLGAAAAGVVGTLQHRDGAGDQAVVAGVQRAELVGGFACRADARTAIGRRVTALGGVPVLRVTKDGAPTITDNGNEIIDVKGLQIADPRGFEAQVNAWPGVVTVGLFAQRGANLCLLGTESGVETIVYSAN